MAKAIIPFNLGAPLNEWLRKMGIRGVTALDVAPLIQATVKLADYSELNAQLRGRRAFCRQRIVGAAATQATNEIVVGGGGISELQFGYGQDDYIFRVYSPPTEIDSSLTERVITWSDPEDPGVSRFFTGNISEAAINFDVNGPFYLIDAQLAAPAIIDGYFPPGVIVSISNPTPQVQLRASITFLEHPGPALPTAAPTRL